MHHSSEHLDWLAAHREHPLDGRFTQLAINLPAILLGFSLSTIAWFVVFRGVWAIYIHSNIRLPLGPLRYLFGAPELHHWHHLNSERSQNFANLAPPPGSPSCRCAPAPHRQGACVPGAGKQELGLAVTSAQSGTHRPYKRALSFSTPGAPR